MSSLVRGDHTSETEISNISIHGLWLFSKGKEFFISYEDFPWFKDQPVAAVHNVEEPSPGHFYWPDLDIDLSKAIIENPARYPLKASSHNKQNQSDA
ncbi:MAG: hypothetical protein NPIRA05_14000 [Nitrospirales bacterium]|nr:MAG: hypothetical protein NPIRA05_14000 [Nitrospirales bacterium]